MFSQLGPGSIRPTRAAGGSDGVLAGQDGVLAGSDGVLPGQDGVMAGRDGHLTVTVTVCQPVAPSGGGGARWEVCTWPSPSVARTRSVCSPDGASHCTRHCRQVSTDGTSASSATRHGPSSTWTSTLVIPRCCAQATPAIVTGPGRRSAPWRGVSI